MNIWITAYLATTVVFFAIDIVWLSVVARTFYFSQLGDLLAPQVNWGVALGFYLLYVVGIVIFAIRPAVESGDWRTAALFGALFGFFCYATYDLTNMATIRDWPVKMSLVDMIWGTVLTSASATGGFLITRWWTGS